MEKFHSVAADSQSLPKQLQVFVCVRVCGLEPAAALRLGREDDAYGGFPISSDGRRT